MTRLLKPIVAGLRTEDFASTSFSDESLQVSESEAESIQNVSAQVKLFRPLAFVHPEKSVLASTQKINSIPRRGNWLQTNVTLTKESANNLLQCCKSAFKAKQILSLIHI